MDHNERKKQRNQSEKGLNEVKGKLRVSQKYVLRFISDLGKKSISQMHKVAKNVKLVIVHKVLLVL